jgi:hypothetical protein
MSMEQPPAGGGTVATKESMVPNGSDRPGLPDDFVIDLTDSAMARMADQHTVIDLRDHVVAAGEAGLITDTREKPKSGRPLDLLPGLELHVLDHEDADERWEKAERFVYDTYRQMDYCEVSPRQRVEVLQSWNDRSRFHVVFDENEEVVGTVRVIADAFEHLPVGMFERTDFVDPDPVAELSSLAVAPNARGLSVVVHLCRSAFVETWATGGSALVFLIDDWMVDLLADTYCLPIRSVGVQRFHMGGDVTPSAMTLRGPEFIDTARRNPHYWRWMTEAFTAQQVVDWELPIVLVDQRDTARAHDIVRALA